jgi:mannosyltransferase OCH1-like enzyme
MSDAGAAVPKTIYSLWLQGMQEAPEIVRAGLARWAALNPDYELRILDRHDIGGILGDLAVDPRQLPGGV